MKAYIFASKNQIKSNFALKFERNFISRPTRSFSKTVNIADRFLEIQRKLTRLAHTDVLKLTRLAHTVVREINFPGLI